MLPSQIRQIASQADRKLSEEVAKAQIDLRRLVGHANLLDRLELALAMHESWLDEIFERTGIAQREEAEIGRGGREGPETTH